MLKYSVLKTCSGIEDISQKTVKAMFQPGTKTRKWLDSLSDDQWQITSFSGHTRLVCFDITNESGTYHASLTLPKI